MTFGDIASLVAADALDSLWYFAAERQRVFYKRIANLPPPWTVDPILRTFRFTNAYRACDRTSQYLIRNVIYTNHREPNDVVFRVILFKLFNKIETWQLLQEQLGEITYKNFYKEHYRRVLGEATKQKFAIYSPAYIMAPPAGELAGIRKHEAHLELVDRMMKDGLPSRLVAARSLKRCFEILAEYPMVGPFLAFQLAIDLNYSEVVNFSEMDFVMPGPGARSGLAKCFPTAPAKEHPYLIRTLAESQEAEFARRGIKFRNLWGRPLQLIDVQNLLCELDKYMRVHRPELRGTGNRKRIKRTFAEGRPVCPPWFPPKWQINDEVQSSLSPRQFKAA